MKGRAKALIKRVVGKFVSEYRINWIYATGSAPGLEGNRPTVEPETAAHRVALLASSTDKMRNSQSYAEAGFAGLVLMQNGRPVSVAHFAEGGEYTRSSTWPLQDGEVCLMDVVTEEHARGRGLAPKLVDEAARRYLAQGRKRLIAFIWWTNTPSLHAFKKAGWKRIGFSVELRFRKRWLRVRVPLR